MDNSDDVTSETFSDKPLAVENTTSESEDSDMAFSDQTSENMSLINLDSSSSNETNDSLEPTRLTMEKSESKKVATSRGTSKLEKFSKELMDLDVASMNILKKKVFSQFSKKKYASGPKSRTKDTDYNAKERLYQKYLLKLKRRTCHIKIQMYKPGPKSLTKDEEYDRLINSYE